MILLDMRTIIFSSVVTSIVCMLVVFFLWSQSRKRFAGTGFWAFDFAFQTAAVFLIILRGSIPDSMSIALANTLIIGGAILGYMGLGHFVRKKTSQFHNYILLAAFACVHAYFAFAQPSLAARNLNLSVALLIICFQCMWFLVYTVEPGMRPLTVGVGMVFGGYCLVSIVRIVRFFTGSPAANDYFHSGAFESLILISYQILFILLTYALALMVNNRLFLEVKTQEEKFAKAFHSSPYTITLTRLSDGEIIEVNERFLNFTGYQYVETIGKTSVDLHLWDKEEDRFVVVNELSKSGKVQDREFQFRKKSGEVIIGLFSAEIIHIDNQEFILSSISDITERKRAEEALKQRSSELQKLAETLEQRVQDRTQELEQANKALRELSIRLLSAQEAERKRVAGEIHDSMGSCLSGIKFKVESAIEEIAKTPKAARQSLDDIVPVIQEAIQECRRIQMDLRPSMLDDLGLLPTLSWFFRRFQTIYSAIRVEQEVTTEESELPNSLKIVIYRVIQEAMNNVAKHSKADLVCVCLQKVHNKMELSVKDNGCGFSVQQHLFQDNLKRGLGLDSMRERTELSGGSFSIESNKGAGTVIRATWPLNT